MKSVNRRDEDLKEKIRIETNAKFDTQNIRKSHKEGLPPTSSHLHSVTTPVNMQNYKRISPKRKAIDDQVRGSGNYSTNIFKLEGKSKGYNSRRGSKTGRDSSENNDAKYNFTKLQERRAEIKAQKNTKSTNNLSKTKYFERKHEERRENKWDRLFKRKDYKENKVLRDLKNDHNMKNSLLEVEGNDSPKYMRTKEEVKEMLSSPQDVLSCLKSPGSPERAVSIIGCDVTRKSTDFNLLLKPEFDSIFTIAGYSDKPIETIENYS